MSNELMTNVTVTERLNYDEAYETLMNSSNVKDTLSELRLCLFADKITKLSAGTIATLFFKILSTMTAKGESGTVDWYDFLLENEERYMFGASNTRVAMMLDKYYTKKKSAQLLGISVYKYENNYSHLIEDKQRMIELMKNMTPYYNLKEKQGLKVIINFLDNFNYLPVERGFLACEHGFKDITEERQLELEFSIICRNLKDALGEMMAYYFVLKLMKNYGIVSDTIDRLWRGLPYIELKLPKTPHNKLLYNDDLFAYGMARGLTKADICRYLLKKPQNYLKSPYICKRFKETNWNNYLCRTTMDWSGLNKNDVINFIEIFRRVAEFLDV